NIVTIYDVGRNEDMAYMAMEYLEGKELKDILADGESLPAVASTVDWMEQIARGLGFAHENDIVHRDVKPSNIMVVRGGLAKITDFGIARMPTSAVKTMTGLILGSPRYMSPEQVIGKTLDHRTDIFSLGVVLHEALTGTPPFDGDNVNAIMYATVNTQSPPPSAANPHVPPMLDLVVAKALTKSVDDRYQTMREFANDLAEVKRLMQVPQTGAKTVTSVSLKANTTIALEPLSVGRYQKHPEAAEETKPLKIAKAFDSFDATLKLAAMTNQTAEFSKYISDTQKMRAYKGEITGSLQPKPSPAVPLPPVAPATRASPWTNDIPYIAPALSRPDRAGTHTATTKLPAQRPSINDTLLHIAVVVVLAILALGLVLYLFAK
ncbi:MAG: serine/threonine-protein kinase, partial [Usitatibacteraceae bacterium]